MSGTKDVLLGRLADAGAGISSNGASARGPAVMIVESPAKCKTIAKFAGNDVTVLASMGHVRTLPSKPGTVRPTEDFAMDFELVRGAGTILKGIGAALRESRALLLATDPDREGEAIAWHVYEALRERKLLPADIKVERVTFSEITEKAVQAALASPRQINLPLVRAQQARQAVDYLVGFTLSPVLWRKLPGCRSAGRVQSVALRVIVEREHEIARFTPQEYWKIAARLGTGGGGGGEEEAAPPSLLAELTHLNGSRLKQFDVGSVEQAEAAVALLPDTWRVDTVKRSKRSTNPPPPYNTASLQQDASRTMGISPSRVMRLAQALYEGLPLGGGEENVALITYMRTDGIEMSSDGINGARRYISKAFGSEEKWLPSSPRLFKRKKRNAQEAHEAVRPVDLMLTPASLIGKIGGQELRLYELIWRRAIASQMASAIHEQLAISLVPEGGEGTAQARTSGSRLLSPGYKALTSQPRIKAAKAEEEEEEERRARLRVVARRRRRRRGGRKRPEPAT